MSSEMGHLFDVSPHTANQHHLRTELVPEERTTRHLAQAGAAGVKWSVLGGLGRVSSSFVIQIALTRLLLPDDFGIMLASMTVIGLMLLFVEFGLIQSIVQKGDVVSGDVEKTLRVQLGMACVLVLVTFAIAPSVGEFFGSARVTSVTRVLTGIIVISAFGMPSQGILRRSMSFKHIQIAQVGSYAFGYGFVGIPLAALGASVTSLIVSQYVQTTVCTALLKSYSRRIVLEKGEGEFAPILKFATRVMPSNVAQWLIINIPNVAIGRSLGTQALAIYNRTFTLAVNPLYAVVSPAQTVVHSTISRLRANQNDVTRTYVAMWSVAMVALLPGLISMGLNSVTVVRALFGEAWIEVADLLLPLGLAMCCYVVASFTGPLVVGLGHPSLESRVQVAAAAMMLIFVLVAVRISLIAVGWAVFASHAINAFLLTVVAIRTLNLDSARVVLFLVGPLATSALIVTATVATDRFMSSLVASSIVVLAMDILVGFTFTCGFILLCPVWTLGKDGTRAVSQLVHDTGLARVTLLNERFSR